MYDYINDDGSSSAYVNITVADIVYDTNSEPLYAVNGTAIDPIAPISTISNSQYEVEPALRWIDGETNGTITVHQPNPYC